MCGVVRLEMCDASFHVGIISTATVVTCRDLLHCSGVCQWWQPSQCLERKETQWIPPSLADEAGLWTADCKGHVLPCQQTGRVTRLWASLMQCECWGNARPTYYHDLCCLGLWWMSICYSLNVLHSMRVCYPRQSYCYCMPTSAVWAIYSCIASTCSHVGMSVSWCLCCVYVSVFADCHITVCPLRPGSQEHPLDVWWHSESVWLWANKEALLRDVPEEGRLQSRWTV